MYNGHPLDITSYREGGLIIQCTLNREVGHNQRTGFTVGDNTGSLPNNYISQDNRLTQNTF